MKILKQALALRHCADKDSSRYALGGVYLDRSADDKVTAAATDGRCLAWATWPEARNGEGDWKGAVLPIDDAAELDKANVVDIYLTDQSEKALTFLTTDKKKNRTVRNFVPVEGRFPHYRDCIPAGRESITTRVDLRLLLKVLKAIGPVAAANQCDSQVIDIEVSLDGDGPVVIRPVDMDEFTDAGAVVMPLSRDR